jgi:hypothetical protein
MPHAIFFMKDGHAIHGSCEVRNLGKPASHGCVRISPQNATILFNLVKKAGLPSTQVVLSGETAGGEGPVASSTKSRKAVKDREFSQASGALPSGGGSLDVRGRQFLCRIKYRTPET